MQLGQVGLFACDARALVEMSDALVAAYHARRATEPDDTGAATNDEEDWVDSHRL
jgi:hypothetical protein